MEIVSLCSLPVASVVWQPRASTWVLTVVCKATFQLHPGVATLASEQEAPYEGDDYWDDDAGRSLHAASDVVPVKPRVDVALVGQAFAPGKRPARSLIVRLTVGEIDKAFEVYCDRTIAQDGQLREGAPFTRMALRYERAAGGPESWNPVGVRRDVADRYGQRPMPNLQPLGALASPSEYIPPVGFGPIAPTWPSRRERLGHLAGRWDATEWRSGPLPEGMDLSYFNAAPPDQQMKALRDDERIVLENLHPDHPRLVTNLPGVRPRALVEGGAGGARALSLRADTLWIDTDQSICTVTWRGQLPIEHPQAHGRVVISMEQPGQGQEATPLGRTRFPSSPKLEWTTERAPSPGGPSEGANPLEGTLVGALKPAPSSALPFAASSPRPEERPRASSAGLPFAPSAATPKLSDSSSQWAAVPSPPPPAPRNPSLSMSVALPPPVPPPRPIIDPPREVAPPPAPLTASASPPLASSSPWAAGAVMSAGTGLTVGAAALATVEPEPIRNDGSLLGSSNAATDAVPWSRQRSEPIPVAAPGFDLRAAPGLGDDAALHLVWFDPESVPRVRRKPEFRQIIKAAEDAPFDPELDDPAFAKDPMALEERREIFEVLARAAAIDGLGMHEALTSAVRRGGKFVPPLGLVEGEVMLPFDELETLKATVAATAAFATSDERLKGAITDAEAVLQKADMPVAPAVLQVLSARIREAFASGKRALSSTELDAQIERALLAKRRYQRREVLGAPHLRALLAMSGVKEALALYLPESLAKQLPMAVRFQVRVVVELYFAVDQYEVSPSAGRALALGWVMSTQRG